MSLFQWPFFRKVYPGIDNPMYVSDIQAANQAVLDGLAAMLDVPNSGFAILSGLEYTTGAPGFYSPGIFMLNGSFYFISGTITEGLYLTGSNQDTESEGFDDGNSRNIYTLQVGSTSNTNVGAGPFSPILSGAMAAYQISNYDLSQAIAALQVTAGKLGSAAFLNVGTTAGTVAAGNDSRFGYSTTYQDATYAKFTDVLVTDATPTPGTFAPTQPNHPANKNYVDTTTVQKLKAGNTGTLSPTPATGNGTTYGVSFGVTLPNTNYMVLLSVISQSAGGVGDTVYAPEVINKTTTGFTLRIVATSTETPDISVDWMIIAFP